MNRTRQPTRFKAVSSGSDWYVLDRAYSHRIVRQWLENGRDGKRQAEAFANALNTKHGPWPVKQ